MAEQYTVRFLPDETELQVDQGTTILTAANEAGVFINCLCGGDGVCGRCDVIVREGRAVGGSTEFFTREEIRQGHNLACEARVESDLVVEVPPEHAAAEGLEFAERDVPHLSDSGSVARNQDLSPLMEPDEHPLLAIRDDVVGSKDHGEGGDRGGKAALAMLANQQVLAEQLIHAIGVLLRAALGGMRLRDGQ